MNSGLHKWGWGERQGEMRPGSSFCLTEGAGFGKGGVAGKGTERGRCPIKDKAKCCFRQWPHQLLVAVSLLQFEWQIQVCCSYVNAGSL